MAYKETFWMACDSAEQLRAEYGPFHTREEAEVQAKKLGASEVHVRCLKFMNRNKSTYINYSALEFIINDYLAECNGQSAKH